MKTINFRDHTEGIDLPGGWTHSYAYAHLHLHTHTYGGRDADKLFLKYSLNDH